MAVVDKGSFPIVGMKVLEETAPVLGDNTMAHGMAFTPRVYSLVTIDATPAAKTVEVKSVDATNVIVTATTAAPDKIIVVLGP